MELGRCGSDLLIVLIPFSFPSAQNKRAETRDLLVLSWFIYHIHIYYIHPLIKFEIEIYECNKILLIFVEYLL